MSSSVFSPSIGFPLHVVQNRSIFMGTTLCCTGKGEKAVRVSAEILGCCERLHSFLGHFEHHLMQVLIQMSDLKNLQSVTSLVQSQREVTACGQFYRKVRTYTG